MNRFARVQRGGGRGRVGSIATSHLLMNRHRRKSWRSEWKKKKLNKAFNREIRDMVKILPYQKTMNEVLEYLQHKVWLCSALDKFQQIGGHYSKIIVKIKRCKVQFVTKWEEITSIDPRGAMAHHFGMFLLDAIDHKHIPSFMYWVLHKHRMKIKLQLKVPAPEAYCNHYVQAKQKLVTVYSDMIQNVTDGHFLIPNNVNTIETIPNFTIYKQRRSNISGINSSLPGYLNDNDSDSSDRFQSLMGIGGYDSSGSIDLNLSAINRDTDNDNNNKNDYNIEDDLDLMWEGDEKTEKIRLTREEMGSCDTNVTPALNKSTQFLNPNPNRHQNNKNTRTSNNSNNNNNNDNQIPDLGGFSSFLKNVDSTKARDFRKLTSEQKSFIFNVVTQGWRNSKNKNKSLAKYVSAFWACKCGIEQIISTHLALFYAIQLPQITNIPSHVQITTDVINQNIIYKHKIGSKWTYTWWEPVYELLDYLICDSGSPHKWGKETLRIMKTFGAQVKAAEEKGELHSIFTQLKAKKSIQKKNDEKDNNGKDNKKNKNVKEDVKTDDKESGSNDHDTIIARANELLNEDMTLNMFDFADIKKNKSMLRRLCKTMLLSRVYCEIAYFFTISECVLYSMWLGFVAFVCVVKQALWQKK